MNTVSAAILIALIGSVILGMMKAKPLIVGLVIAVALPPIFFFSQSPFGTGKPPNSDDLFAIAPWFILFMAFTGLPAFAAGFAGAIIGRKIVNSKG